MNCTTFRNFASAFLFASSLAIVSCNSDDTDTSDGDTTDTTASISHDTAAGHESNQATRAEATIASTYPDTSVTGTATFETVNGKVKMMLNITAPSKANKTLAVHIHEHPGCGDNGKDAHGHWNPTKVNHGKWGSDAFHSGDIGNVELDGDGKGSKELETDRWTIGGDSTTNILNRSIIVHGGVDDFKTQPTGNAGNRIGCGIINRR
jgi:Cu-Zn family superoxide dismutase